MPKRLLSNSGFTLPIVFMIFSTYTLFISFYLIIYVSKLETINDLTDYYTNEISILLKEGEHND